MSDDPLLDLRTKVQFPVMAVSRAGWTKRADAPHEFDASPTDDLADWQGMEIYDSAGRRFVARRAFRAWPKSTLGAMLCRVANNAIHVAFDLDDGEHISVDALKEKLDALTDRAGRLDSAKTHREVIEQLLIA